MSTSTIDPSRPPAELLQQHQERRRLADLKRETAEKELAAATAEREAAKTIRATQVGVRRTRRQTAPGRRSWLLGLLVVVGVVAMLAVAVVFRPHEPDAGDSAGMRIDFGYGQEPLSRNLTFPLCREGDLQAQLSYPECAVGADLTKLPRPEVTSAIPAGDLLPAQTRAGCPDIRGGSAFPSQQLEVTASNFDVQGLTLAVTADPTRPEHVSPGTYCGTLVVTRSAGGLIEQPIVITVGDRWQLLIVYRVIFSLFLGAAIGALLKWVGDNIGNPAAGSVPPPGRSATPLHWVRYHAGLVLGLATALAVALTGATSQYIQDATFNDDFLDYFALLIWALTGQLAGQTLIDIAGNVKPLVGDLAAADRAAGDRTAADRTAADRRAAGAQVRKRGQRVPASSSSIRSKEPTDTE